MTDLNIVPSSQSLPTFKSSAQISSIACDERAIGRLLEMILHKSGLSIGEVARRMGVTPNAIRQYLKGRRAKPSLWWVIRLAETCGSRVTIEFPASRLG